MKSLIVISLVIGGMFVATTSNASTVRINCSNSNGSVRVDMTSQEVVLLGKRLNIFESNDSLNKTITYDAETTHLDDNCYAFTISKPTKKIKVENVPGVSNTSHYTVDFKMQQTCRRISSLAYSYLAKPGSGAIEELLLCKEYKGF